MKVKVVALGDAVVSEKKWEDREYTVTEFMADMGGEFVGFSISECTKVIKKGDSIEVNMRRYESIGAMQGKARGSLV